MDQCECSSCGEKYPSVQFFHCANFAEKQEIAGAVDKLCESCIVPHIRKHAQDVTDAKGNKPLVCTEHKIPRLQYCRTCDLAFCSHCVSYHSKHEFQTLAEKDKELKKKIHEILTDLETVKEKPLRLRKEEISKLVEEKRREIANLKQSVDKKLNQSKLRTNEILDRKLDRVIAEENEVKILVDELVKMQAKCRTLLGMSTVSILESLPNKRREIEKFNENYECSMTKKVKLDIVDVNSMEYLIEKTEIKIKKAVEEERIKEEHSVFLAASTSTGNALVHEVQKNPYGSLKISTIDCSGTEYKTSYSSTLPVSPNLNVERVFPMGSQVLIKFDTGPLILFDGSEESFKFFDQPAKTSLLWPYLTMDRKVEWSYWDDERKKIKFTHEDQCEIECEQKPFIRMSCSDPGVLCFVDANLVIITIATFVEKDKQKQEIQPRRHLLQSIDCISSNPTEMFVWSVSAKTVNFLQKDGDGAGIFHLMQTISWPNKPEILEVNLKSLFFSETSCRILPSMKHEDSLEEKYDLFGVWP